MQQDCIKWIQRGNNRNPLLILKIIEHNSNNQNNQHNNNGDKNCK